MNYGDSLEKNSKKPCNLGDVVNLDNDNILRWREDLPKLPDNSKLDEILSLLTALQYDKELTYGSSWKGKGEVRGIMANIDRKYDRIDKIIMDETEGKREKLPKVSFNELSEEDKENIGESKIDAVADLANYCLLYMTFMKDTYPGAFELWVRKNIPAYMADRLSLYK